MRSFGLRKPVGEVKMPWNAELMAQEPHQQKLIASFIDYDKSRESLLNLATAETYQISLYGSKKSKFSWVSVGIYKKMSLKQLQRLWGEEGAETNAQSKAQRGSFRCHCRRGSKKQLWEKK